MINNIEINEEEEKYKLPEIQFLSFLSRTCVGTSAQSRYKL